MCKFPNKKLLFTDTDLMCYEIVTDDWYKDILPDLDTWFDTSGYEENHFLYSKVNKKVTGKFSDELGGKIMYEFVGLKAKLYSYITDDWCYENDEVRRTSEKKISKGTDRATIKHVLRHADYITCLFDKVKFTREVTRIVSKNHHLTTATMSKIVLSYDDDKRVMVENSFHTLAWGHCDLRDL